MVNPIQLEKSPETRTSLATPSHVIVTSVTSSSSNASSEFSLESFSVLSAFTAIWLVSIFASILSFSDGIFKILKTVLFGPSALSI